MADNGTLQVAHSSTNQPGCYQDEIDSLLMSTVGWQSSSTTTGDPNDLLSGLILNGETEPDFLSDLLAAAGSENGSGLFGSMPYPTDQSSPSSAITTSDDGSTMLNSLSPHYFNHSPTNFSTSPSEYLSDNFTTSAGQDVHIDVESGLSSSAAVGSSSDRKTGSMAVVTEEERDLLSREGITIPIGLPLTKSEEKHIKRIRRKIKNKQSAADSRKRKKDYVDGLERRVEKCTEMNNSLVKKVRLLENENQTLVEQLKRLQKFVAQYNPSKLQAGSMMMIVILSFSLLVVPQFYKPHNVRVATSFSRSLLDVSTDEFGNIADGFVGIAKDRTPLLPLPWHYQSPAIKPWNYSQPQTRSL